VNLSFASTNPSRALFVTAAMRIADRRLCSWGERLRCNGLVQLGQVCPAQLCHELVTDDFC
jgi:hypothetical protein